MSDEPKSDLSYLDAMHAIQTGVAVHMQFEPSIATPKHLRVGIDSAMVNDAALVRLLVKKGLITHEEYGEELRLEANREVDRSEATIQAITGSKVSLR